MKLMEDVLIFDCEEVTAIRRMGPCHFSFFLMARRIEAQAEIMTCIRRPASLHCHERVCEQMEDESSIKQTTLK